MGNSGFDKGGKGVDSDKEGKVEGREDFEKKLKDWEDKKTQERDAEKDEIQKSAADKKIDKSHINSQINANCPSLCKTCGANKVCSACVEPIAALLTISEGNTKCVSLSACKNHDGKIEKDAQNNNLTCTIEKSDDKKLCELTNPGCAKCGDDGNCTECKVGSFKHTNGKCLPECKIDERGCTECENNFCKTCGDKLELKTTPEGLKVCRKPPPSRRLLEDVSTKAIENGGI